MQSYTLHTLVTRCFAQKVFQLGPDIRVIPLLQTGLSPELESARRQLATTAAKFPKEAFLAALQNFINAGQSVLLEYTGVRTNTWKEAIDGNDAKLESTIGRLGRPECESVHSIHDNGGRTVRCWRN
jgi:hypothetical protein